LKAKVKSKFRDKETKEVYKIGSVYESDSLARMRELMQKGFLYEAEIEEKAEHVEEVETPEEKKEDPAYKHIGGGVYELADGTRVKGKDKAIEAAKKK
jgi:hypothetical protein